jgi:hypothetical protein
MCLFVKDILTLQMINLIINIINPYQPNIAWVLNSYLTTVPCANSITKSAKFNWIPNVFRAELGKFNAINFYNAFGYSQSDFNLDDKSKFDNPIKDKNTLFSQIIFPHNENVLSNCNFFIEQIPESNR